MLSEHDVLCRLVTALVQSNRRWQMVMFPLLFGFTLLAGYAFYLVVNLVQDIDTMARAVDVNMGFMSERMAQISRNLDGLTGSVRDISVNLDDLTGTVTAMNGKLDTLPPMLDSIRNVDVRIGSVDQTMRSLDGHMGTMTATLHFMNESMAAVTVATQHISGNVSGLNQNIGRPMNFMNSIMPW
jgi:methyl-accepting chemotaxis protein